MSEAPTILLVEDDEVFREAVHRLLGARYRIVEAATGRAAKALSQTESIACVLLDNRLPDGSGLELLPLFSAAAVPVVMLTSAGSEAVAVRAMKRGCHDYLVKRDLTEDRLVRAIESAIERAAFARALRAQQEELYAFVATAAHDLKGPLRHVVQYCEFAEEELERRELRKVSASLSIARTAAQRLHGLVSALLHYTKLETAAREFEPVDLDQVVVGLCTEINADLAAIGGRVEARGLPTVVGDRELLAQLFQNLLSNAIKFRGDEPLRVRIGARHDGDEWCIDVTDNGIGIAGEHHEVVFEPLRRLHGVSEYEGHGIGLATCRRIVARHGGRIWIESTVGEGTTFRFTLAA